jgi:hypothetical protein
MARARNIKPGFAKNENLAECSLAARLCFALLPMLADREGRLEDRPKRIKGELFPFDALEVEPLLAELSRFGFIERYAVETRGLIQIIAFHKHQHPHHKEPESVLPPPQSLRLDDDGKWVKPEALPSSHEPEAPDKSEALMPTGGHASRQNRDVQGGSNPADSGALIPESGFRSTDSGKGGERERERNAGGKPATAAAKAATAPPRPRRMPCPEGVDAAVWDDWLTLRKAKRAPVTATVLEGARTEAAKAGLTLEAFLRVWCRRGSQGLEAAWLKADERGASSNGRHPLPQIDTEARNAESRRLLGFAPNPPPWEIVDA